MAVVPTLHGGGGSPPGAFGGAGRGQRLSRCSRGSRSARGSREARLFRGWGLRFVWRVRHLSRAAWLISRRVRWLWRWWRQPPVRLAARAEGRGFLDVLEVLEVLEVLGMLGCLGVGGFALCGGCVTSRGRHGSSLGGCGGFGGGCRFSRGSRGARGSRSARGSREARLFRGWGLRFVRRVRHLSRAAWSALYGGASHFSAVRLTFRRCGSSFGGCGGFGGGCRFF